MPRKRSYRELTELRERIEARQERDHNYDGNSLTSRAAAQAYRYSRNIANSKSGKAASARFKSAVEAGDTAKREQIRETMLNRQYSANTYKGLSVG